MQGSTLRRPLLALAVTLLVLVAVPSIAAAAPVLPWQTGQVALSNGSTIEPAVNDVTGAQTFLLTPNNAPFSVVTPGDPIPPAFTPAAPLYLVTYPIDSTADAGAPFNCYTEGFFTAGLPYNCDHAQIPGIKGHDHLVGVPGTQHAGGDYNVQWHVLVTVFTPKGISDGAMNVRLHTLAQVEEAQANGDVSPFQDTGIYFYCAAVSGSTYMSPAATHLNFSVGQP